MDLSVIPPENGAGSGAFGAAPQPAPELTSAQVKKHFDFVDVGTRRRLILLGDIVSQRMHFSMRLNYKVMCTARAGHCELCQMSLTASEGVSKSHFEHYGPCAVQGQGKDRRYHQRVVVFTELMYEGSEQRDGLKQFLTDGPTRGHAFDVSRSSKHDFKIVPVKNAPRALAHALPGSFHVLAWIRARFNLPQDPHQPLTLFQPFAIQDLGSAPASRPRELDITASDIRSADEWEKTKAKLAEARELLKSAKPSGAAGKPAEVPAAPAPVEALAPTAPVVPTAPATSPEPAPAPVAPATGPKKKVVSFTVPEPDPAEVARNEEQREEAEKLRRATFEGKDRLSVVDTVGLGELFKVPGGDREKVPSLNGRHLAKKGGGK